jgi:hypothetical protein
MRGHAMMSDLPIRGDASGPISVAAGRDPGLRTVDYQGGVLEQRERVTIPNHDGMDIYLLNLDDRPGNENYRESALGIFQRTNLMHQMQCPIHAGVWPIFDWRVTFLFLFLFLRPLV